MSEIFSVRTFATANHIRQRIIDVHALRAKMSVNCNILFQPRIELNCAWSWN